MSRLAATRTAKRRAVSRCKAASARARAGAEVSPATDTTRAPAETSAARRRNSAPSATRRSAPPKTEADSTDLLITYYCFNPFDDAGRRGAFDEGEREDAAARRLDLLAAVYLGGRVVAALDEHVGQKFGDEPARRLVVKDGHEVNNRERGQHLGALRLTHHGSARAFERAHRAVAVDRDEQRVSERARRREVAHVPDMQDVEAAVGEDEPAPVRAQARADAQQPLHVENHPAPHWF